MRIIAIANQKGGCGKTTTAINLASSLAALNNKILLIDMDPQSHASAGLNVNAEGLDETLYDVLMNKANINEAIKNISENLDLVPAGLLLSTMEQELSNKEDRVTRLITKIETVEGAYDFVVIDCPPSLGFLTFNALRAADEVLIPTEASFFSLNGLNRLLELVELLRRQSNHEVQIRALVTMFDRRPKHSLLLLSHIKNYFRDRMFNTVIGINVALREAQGKGVPILKFNKYATGARDYLSLAEEVLLEDVKVKQRPQRKECAFKFHAPEAQEVHIVGDFNNWTITGGYKLEKEPAGSWSTKLPLGPGTYRYKFVVDGQWMHDPNNPNSEANPFGGIDSVVTVK